MNRKTRSQDTEPVVVSQGPTALRGESIDWAANGKAQPVGPYQTVYELRNQKRREVEELATFRL